MDAQFNPDGSIKLPGWMQQARADDANRMKVGRCLRVLKEVVRTNAPKECVMHLTLSEKMANDQLIESVYKRATSRMETPMKFERNGNDIKITVGTAFKRCQECTQLIGALKDYVAGNLILEKGNCTYDQHKGRNFSFEDHFE